MIKYLSIIFFFIFATVKVYGQVISGPETIKNYSISQKSLLVINTFQFELFITHNLDHDSLIAIACRITGMPFLVPYNEILGHTPSPCVDLINAGRIEDATLLSDKLENEQKTQSLIELSMWYLYQPGTNKKDLDSADLYIASASHLARKRNSFRLEKECSFLSAELSYQRGNIQKSRIILNEVLASAQKDGNKETIARAYQQLGSQLPMSDSVKLLYYQKSFKLYHQLQFKEKEIEVLVNIALCEELVSMKLMEMHLRQALSLMQSINFKHILYIQNMLTFALVNQAKYKDALKYAEAAIQNMKWAGMSSVAGAFYYRLGGVYEGLGKNDLALYCFKKAIHKGNAETHIFWYKSLFFAHALLTQMNKPAASLSLINTVILESPPLTLWEKMQVFACKGQSYEKLNNPESANENYTSLLEIAASNPFADPFGELSYTYLDIANFYISYKNLSKARSFLKLGLQNLIDEPYENSNKYSLLFKIDSSQRNFKSALQIHLLYKLYYDSLAAIDQRQKINELRTKYAAEKKDQDITLLKQQRIIQQAEIRQNKITKNVMLGATILLLIIVGLLVSRFRVKQRNNAATVEKNAALRRLVIEKEWLLKEVHHRVKNNLHTVICLLESQADYLQEDALKANETSKHRIYAMSLIHQQLYNGEDIKVIDMSIFLPELLSYLVDSFGTENKIRYIRDIGPIKLGVSQAIPVALIVNETVTNSIKYAFPAGKTGIINISMHQSGEAISLVIADNGIGINPAVINTESNSMGLKLMKGLATDINGELNIKNENGTKVTINFNPDPLNEFDSFSNNN